MPSVDGALNENFFVCCPQMSVVWSSSLLPWIVTYDNESRRHTIYLLRKAEGSNEELNYFKAKRGNNLIFVYS